MDRIIRPGRARTFLWIALYSALFGCDPRAATAPGAAGSSAPDALSNAQIDSDMDRRDRELARAREEARARDAARIATRLGMKSPDEPLYATLETTAGPIVVQLYWQRAPYTVQNFVTLAEGVREWRDPATGLPVKRPFYDGLTFHRVIPDFMIQAGDPTGTGRYTPGYTLPDEIDPSLHFDKPGVVAMANAGQDTNGSQFFIVEKAPLAQLPDGKYPIFGQVIEGMDAVHAIAQGERDKDDHPLHPVVIRHVRIGHGAPTGSTGNP